MLVGNLYNHVGPHPSLANVKLLDKTFSLSPSLIVGQFWNIPISVDDVDSDGSPDIQPGHSSYRHFPALFYHLVWDLSEDGCYYVGNSQGGSERSHDPINSVTEGSYPQYIVDGLFDTEFAYERFEESACFG